MLTKKNPTLVYNKTNVTGMLIEAQQHKNLVKNILHPKKQVDQESPRKYTHLKGLGTKYDVSRQRDIDTQNQKLLTSIMDIMKRRNKSVIQARAIPEVLVGGSQTI